LNVVLLDSSACSSEMLCCCRYWIYLLPFRIWSKVSS
jgi:hypothetical protein